MKIHVAVMVGALSLFNGVVYGFDGNQGDRQTLNELRQKFDEFQKTRKVKAAEETVERQRMQDFENALAQFGFEKMPLSERWAFLHQYRSIDRWRLKYQPTPQGPIWELVVLSPVSDIPALRLASLELWVATPEDDDTVLDQRQIFPIDPPDYEYAPSHVEFTTLVDFLRQFANTGGRVDAAKICHLKEVESWGNPARLESKYKADLRDYATLTQELRVKGFMLRENSEYVLQVNNTQITVHLFNQGFHGGYTKISHSTIEKYLLYFETATDLLNETNNLKTFDYIIKELELDK